MVFNGFWPDHASDFQELLPLARQGQGRSLAVHFPLPLPRAGKLRDFNRSERMSGLKLRRTAISILGLAASIVILAMAGCTSTGAIKLGGAGAVAPERPE